MYDPVTLNGNFSLRKQSVSLPATTTLAYEVDFFTSPTAASYLPFPKTKGILIAKMFQNADQKVLEILG